MSFLIKGLEMPIEKPVIFQVYPDGTVRRLNESIFKSHAEAIPVPLHGRLVDADVLAKVMIEGIAPSIKDGGFKHPFDIIRAIADAPTIIEAEEGET